VPFILVSSVLGEEPAVAAMKAGANDFVPKSALGRLMPAIEREVRHHREARERAREVSRLKAAFLSTVSHEIRLPLQVLISSADLLEEIVTERDDLGPVLTSMRDAGARILDTITAVLELSKLEAGAFETCPISVEVAPLLESVVREFVPRATAKQLSLSCEIDARDAITFFDEHCLAQVIRKLLDNAVKFTPRGSIAVRLSYDHEGALCLEIRDTGVGIDESFLKRLGESFSQEDPGDTRPFEGAGTGLALVRRFLGIFAARLSAESRKGEGSVFRVHFADEPAARTAAIAAGALALGDRPEGRPVILAVEDDPPTQSYLERALRARYDLVFVRTGAEADDRLADGDRRVRLVLMDLSTPSGEESLRLGRKLREGAPGRTVPVLGMDVPSSPARRRRALEGGCDAFLPMPLSSRVLISTIERLLDPERSGRATA